MANFVFSPSRRTFFPTVFRAKFEEKGDWPADAVEVSDATFYQYCHNAPVGMTRGADSEGQPTWVPRTAGMP